MKETNFFCDKCKKQINNGVYQLDYKSGDGGAIMGDNRFPDNGLHYHYDCFGFIVHTIVECNEKGEQKITYV